MDPTPELGVPGPEPSADGLGTHFDPFSAPAEAAAMDRRPSEMPPALTNAVRLCIRG